MMLKQLGVGIVVAASFLGWSGTVFADFSKTNWGFSKEIVFPRGISKRTLVELELDREVLDHASQNDVRIISNTGTETPFLVRETRAERTLESFTPRMQNLSSVPGSHTSFVLDFARSVLHNEITINTPSKNFRKSVMVEGSDDGRSWQRLVDKAIIYDYTLEFVAHDTQVVYPESTFRYLRITINDPDAPPIVVAGAMAYRMVSQDGKNNSYEVTPTSREIDKSTEVVVDLGSRGVLTERADLGISGQDFERQVVVYGSDDGVSWSTQGNDVVYSYKTSRLEGSKTSISWRGTRTRYLKFTIVNNDNPPLYVNSVRLYGPAQEVVFLADAVQRYRLFYGNSRATPPTYDFSSVSRYFTGDPAIRISLGNEVKNPDYEEPKPPVPPLSERMPYLIPTILGLLMTALVLILFNLLKRTK